MLWQRQRAATVTDAHVVLGRIGGGPADRRPDASGYGTRSHGRRFHRAPAWHQPRSAAQGILRVANANMERAIRLVSVERGHDPRDFALVAFGGCGGLHACEIARELGIRTVLVPEYAGALSALGMLLASQVRDYAAGVLNRRTSSANSCAWSAARGRICPAPN